jgi:hypothetical protein
MCDCPLVSVTMITLTTMDNSANGGSFSSFGFLLAPFPHVEREVRR